MLVLPFVSPVTILGFLYILLSLLKTGLEQLLEPILWLFLNISISLINYFSLSSIKLAGYLLVYGTTFAILLIVKKYLLNKRNA